MSALERLTTLARERGWRIVWQADGGIYVRVSVLARPTVTERDTYVGSGVPAHRNLLEVCDRMAARVMVKLRDRGIVG